MDNTMTFFSGTDTNTLREEGKDRNHFVSLIVNNEGTYTAAITRKIKTSKSITDNYSYPTFENEIIQDTDSYTNEEEVIEWFYLNIEFEGDIHNSYKDLNTRLDILQKEKEEKNKTTTSYKGLFSPEIDKGRITQSHESFVGPANIITPNDSPLNDAPIRNYYGKIYIDKNKINLLVKQLITGSIIIPNESKIDIKKWAQGMVPLYEKRFGKGENGLKLFKVWAESYIEFLCWFSEDFSLQNRGLDDDEIAAVYAWNIINELSKLPQNVYIEEYIDILEGYLKNIY